MPKEEDVEEAAFRERVRNAIQHGGKSGEMSKKTGIPVGTLNKYVALRSSPSVLNAAKIASAVGLTIEELATGQMQVQNQHQDLGDQHQAQSMSGIGIGRSDFVAIPHYNVHAAAGNGIIAVDEEEQSEAIILTRTYLRKIGARPESCHIIFAKGQSMLPNIPDGAMMLIDLSKRRIIDRGVFVFRVHDEIKVKRALLRLDGRVDLASDNPMVGGPPETYALDEVEIMAPVGRVMCILREP